MAEEPSGYLDESSSRLSVVGIGSTVLGYGLVRLTGLAGLIPLGVGVGSYFLLRSFWPQRKLVVPAVAATFGQIGWILLGAVIMNALAQLWLDLLVPGLIAAWLLWRPSTPAAIAMILFQLVGTALNVMTLDRMQLMTPDFKALVVHIALRVFIIGAAIYFIFETKTGGDDEWASEEVPANVPE
ncbi:MAG TPA: hypothetical protein VGX37_06705 [Allosphingosinicella sp.]|jgi:hypothetical protein|nr:hypothetical protein [Allosphingosinicella sp.]